MTEDNARNKTRLITRAFGVFVTSILLFAVCSGSGAAYADGAEYGGTRATGAYANPDQDGDGFGDNIAFSVPTSVRFVIEADGTLVGPSNACIQNHGQSCMYVSSVRTMASGGFEFTENAPLAEEQNRVWLSIGTGHGSLDAARCQSKTEVGDPRAWGIDCASQLPLVFDGKVSSMTADAVMEKAFGSIEWFVQADPDGLIASRAYAVLDSDGKLTLFRSCGNYCDGEDQSVTDIMGNVYHGRIYSGVEESGDMEWSAPWYEQRDLIRSFDIVDGQTIIPKNTAGWFARCGNLTRCDLAGIDTSNVVSMSSMFAYCTSLPELDVSCLDTSHAVKMNKLFRDCSGLTELDVSNFDTSNVTYPVGMFDGCSGLTSLDVSNFETSKMETLNSMFYGCSGLTSLDLSNFDTRHVRSFGCMFMGSENLETVDLSSFITPCAWSTNAMFRECKKLVSVDMSGFEMSGVEDTYEMFGDCHCLTTVYVKPDADWSVSLPAQIPSMNMFRDAYSIVGGEGTVFDASKTDREYARADGLDGKPGYFTAKLD